MQHVELQSAFVWYCPACGQQHYSSPKSVAMLDDETMEDIIEGGEGFVQVDFLAEDADVEKSEEEDGMMQSPVLINRVSILPRFVTCGNCGGKFMGIAELDEEDDDEESE